MTIGNIFTTCIMPEMDGVWTVVDNHYAQRSFVTRYDIPAEIDAMPVMWFKLEDGGVTVRVLGTLPETEEAEDDET